jgi:uncharacterized membrane protein YgdD (TMEM256/DUF423 family)
MNYTGRNTLYLINKFILYLSFILTGAFLFLSLIDAGNFKKWITWCGCTILTGIILFVLNISRKSVVPVAGRDYL